MEPLFETSAIPEYHPGSTLSRDARFAPGNADGINVRSRSC